MKTKYAEIQSIVNAIECAVADREAVADQEAKA